VFGVAGLSRTWSMEDFLGQAVDAARAQVGSRRVLVGLSGGVDSAVVAAILCRAIPGQVVAILVDNGLLREGERADVEATFGHTPGMDFRCVDAADRFLAALGDATEPEDKRKRIGETFIRVFESAVAGAGPVDFLAQGTLYPDVIESVSVRGPSHTIKSHHNVGGLPADLKFELVEPLRELFKDEVRRLGTLLGLPDRVVNRQPFPGPGLAVRCLGPVTAERLAVLRAADAILNDELSSEPGFRDLWQSFAVLLPVRTVGVMGDRRTYDEVVALRVVTSQDGMTADCADVPLAVLKRVAGRIVNRVRGVNRVVFDLTSKPPATIEWE
jgi:GMP synthase (glutamine-hydrolysing)